MNKEIINHLALNDGLITRLNPYLSEGMPNIFDYEYKTKVLGISGYINENSSVEEKRLVIEEYLLMEGFWDDIKSFPKDLMLLMKKFKEAVSTPGNIENWVKSLEVKIVNKGKEKIEEFLKNVKESAEKLGLDKIAKGITKVIKFFEDSFIKIKGYGGWKTAVSLTGMALSIKYVIDKIGEGGLNILTTPIAEMSKDFLTNLLDDNIFDGLKKTLVTGLGSLLNGVTGIGAFISWGRKIFNGIKFVVETLKNTTYYFSGFSGVWNFNKDDSSDIEESFSKPTKTKRLIKKLIREGLEIKKYEKLLIDSVIEFMQDKLKFKPNKIVVKKKSSNTQIGDVVLSDASLNKGKFTLHYNPDQGYRMIIGALVHELTHVKQITNGELRPSEDWNLYYGKMIQRFQ